MWLGLPHSMAAEFQEWMSHEAERQMEVVWYTQTSVRSHTLRFHFKMTFEPHLAALDSSYPLCISLSKGFGENGCNR